MPYQPATTVWCKQGWGAKALLSWQPVITYPSHPNKDGRATDSCFSLVGAHQVSSILILPGESLANGYYKWHPEKKGKKYMYTKQTQKNEHIKWCKNNTVKIMLLNDCQFHATESTFE